MKTLTYSVMILILLIGFSAKTQAAQSMIDSAETARLEAKALGFEWSTTTPLIKQAIEASQAGDKDKALKLAQKALKEAQNAIKQAKYAEENWRESEPN